MKRMIAAGLALSMLGSPLAMAQQPPPYMGEHRGQGGPPPPGAWHGGPRGQPGYRHEDRYHRDYGYDHRRLPPPGYGWGRGQRIPPGYHYEVVQNWHHHRGLYAPPPGHRWLQYDNQFYLVAISSGLIGAILGAAAAGQY